MIPEVSRVADGASPMIACAGDNLEAALFVGTTPICAGLADSVERQAMLAVRLSGWHHPPQ
jgi:hypothetical protein